MHQERISFSMLLSLGSAWDNTRHQSRHGWQHSSVLSIWQQQYGGLSILWVRVPRNRHICLSVWSEWFFFQHPSCIHQATSVFLGCVRMVKWMWVLEPAVLVVHFITFYFCLKWLFMQSRRRFLMPTMASGVWNVTYAGWFTKRFHWNFISLFGE